METEQAAGKLSKDGWGVIPPQQYCIDMEASFKTLWDIVKPYTMISIERGYTLYKGVEYIVKKRIPGDFVECGVWKGGSCLLMALTLMQLNATGRSIFLYDTFTGMSEPTDEDVIAWNGKHVHEKWERDDFNSWAVSRETVYRNLVSSGAPPDMFRFVEGDVEQTLVDTVPDKIALLRLDTDWYASTAKELEILYPLISTGGVLVIDDYGHFEGARKAVDDYFENDPILLTRVDYTGRQGIKIN